MAAASLPRSAAGNHNPWLIAIVVSIATFMEVLDTTIANVSLRHIAGTLGASQDESTWILTSYLISNAIVLPISGWLSQLIGRKRFYMICVALFTVSSFLCAFAPNLGLMLLFRVMQGIGGGGLAPTEQSIFADSFPPEKRASAFAFYGITVIVAPAVGPVLGGWLTDFYSWHWIFLINLPVGLLSLCLIWFLVDEPQAVKDDTKKFRAHFVPDWLGFLLVALTFGCLQVVLDRFQQDDGFASQSITIFFVTTVFAAVALIWWELRHPQPVFDVRLFKTRSFATACALMFLLGFTLYSTTQLLPQLAQTLLGYNAFDAGKALAMGGLVAVLVMPIAGVIGKKIPGKFVLLVAFVVTGCAFLHTAHLNLLLGFGDLSRARIYQSVALPFLFVTLTTAGYVGIPPEKNASASAIINLMRNLGGSVGVSIATTTLAWRTQFHHARLADHVSKFDVGPGSFAHVDLATAQMQVQQQAQALSYFDVFWLFGVAALIVAPFALILKSPPKERLPVAIDRLKRIVWATAWIACAACTVGPEPRRPDVDTPARYPTTADPARRQALSADLPSQIVERTSDARRWWSVFGDPVLDGLVDDALTQNLDVQQTALRIAEARAQRDATASAFYPEVEASGIAGRSRMSENGIGKALAGGGSSGGSSSGGAASSSSPPSTFNLFQVGFDATWEPDLWGKTRRGVQADAATLRSAEESRHDAMVSLAAEIARAYLTLRGAERQRDIALADIATQEHLRELVDSRNQSGLAPASDVAAQQVQVSASRAQLPQIEQAIAINRNRLALLLAMPPGSLDARLVPQPTTPGSGEARFASQPMTPGSLEGRPGPHPTPPVGLDARLAARPTPMLPPEVPVGLPGDLLRRRPDVRQREAEAEAATARIGVARAMLFPRVRFGATGGLQATESSNLFDWASRFGIFGAQLSLPIFEGGRLHAQVVIADLRAQEAVLNYRQTVLGAFHDVDNALTTYAQDQHRTVDLSRQLEGANRSRDLAADRYRAGLGAFIDVLTADHQSHQASLDLAQSQVTASTDLVALFKALGGGWDDGDAASR